MRIAIIAPGSRGDVQPYIALGKGLEKAAHVVRLVTHQNFGMLVNLLLSPSLVISHFGGSA